MQKNDRFYTFLLSHSTKTKKYIRHIEISKKLLHASLTILILTIGIVLTGAAGIVKNTVFAKTETIASVQAAVSNPPISQQKAEYKSISYDRPESDIDVVYDSETDSTIKLTPAETQAAANSLEAQIQTIIKTSSPAFLPTMWAHFGKINNEFGFRRNPFGGGSEFHPGLDINGEKGDLVVAPASGIVSKAGWQGGYGNMIEIDHGNGLTTRYGHLSRIEVAAGTAVQRGQFIGLVGSTGRSTGAHLHFEIRLNDHPINPRRFLPSAQTEIAALNPR